MKRSKFSLSHTKLASCDLGELIPIGLLEVLPGDTIQQSTSALVRCAAMLAPVMHPVSVTIHHWYCPLRLLWDNFQNFITGGPDGLNASVYPTITTPASTGFLEGSLADYLGVTPGVASRTVSALPFRAYAAVWNDWYRDQDLQTPLVMSKADGADTTTNTTLQNGCWEKDYFTSSRPWEQKGVSVTLPLGTTAPITGLGVFGNAANAGATIFGTTAAGDMVSTQPVLGQAAGQVLAKMPAVGAASGSNRPQIFADLANASAVTVTALRQALAIQRFEEARARYGSQYTDYLAYLGVTSSDARLQRCEYLGGGRQVIQFSEVLQTAEGANPVGELRGHGITGARSNRYRRFIEEHGYILSLMCVRPKTIYADGLNRHWNRRVKEDFWQKELEHIGQQKVLNKEVRFNHATPDGTFGFQDRYDEYRRQESSIAGEFRSTTLNFWHFARQFATDPALNATFVSSVPTERPFAVPSKDVIYVQAKHSIQARRLVTKTGTSFIF